MADETVNRGLTIGDSSDPMRMIARRKRLQQSLERAEGERAQLLQAEIDSLTERIDELKAALADD